MQRNMGAPMIPQTENQRTDKNLWDSWAGLLSWGMEELRAFGPHESQTNAEYLLEEASGGKYWKLYLEEKDPPSGAVVETYKRWIAARKRRMPAGYVTGRAYFRNEILEAGPGCFVPRPETERLMEAVIEKTGFPKDAKFSFLDLGTGSGAIGISLLRYFENACAVLSDISEGALAIARRNAARYGLQDRAEIIKSDLFENFLGRAEGPQAGRRWTLIVCNPPYLAEQDWTAVDPELGYEPRIALDGGADGFDYYRNILKEAAGFLLSDGWIFFEVGRGQAPVVARLLEESCFKNVQIVKDLAGIERIVAGQKKSWIK